MPVFQAAADLLCPPEKVYDFLIRPANSLLVTPPTLKAVLLDAPEVLSVGSRLTIRVWRYGMPQTMTSVVTALEPARLLRDEQAPNGGPFRRWAHTHSLEVTAAGTRMTDRVDFDPPGGMLGLFATEAVLLRELAEMFAYRTRRFKELLDGSGA
jgi:ligand-binding SRPBCC domain-containing protein